MQSKIIEKTITDKQIIQRLNLAKENIVLAQEALDQHVQNKLTDIVDIFKHLDTSRIKLVFLKDRMPLYLKAIYQKIYLCKIEQLSRPDDELSANISQNLNEYTHIYKELWISHVTILEKLVDLSKTLANEYYNATIKAKENPKKQGLIKYAREEIVAATEFEKEKAHAFTLDFDNTDPKFVENCDDLKQLSINIMHEYEVLLNDSSEINTILIRARRVRNPKILKDEFQKALNIAIRVRDYSYQLHILMEQINHYDAIIYKKLLGDPRNTGCIKEYFDIMSQTYETAAELALSGRMGYIDQIRCNEISDAYYYMANYVLSITATQNISTKTIPIFLNLLENAVRYCKRGEELGNPEQLKKMSQSIFAKLVSDHLKLIQLMIEETNRAKIAAGKKELNTLQCKKNYDEKFSETLQAMTDLDNQKMIKIKRKKPVQTLNVNNIVSKDESSSSSDESVSIRECAEDPNQKKLSPLEKAIQSLENAEKNHANLIEQAMLNVTVSEFYIIDASRLTKRGNRSLNELNQIIDIIQDSMQYLLKANSLISNIKSSTNITNHQDLKQLQDWTYIILSKNSPVLSETIDRYKIIEDTLEKSRQAAMQNLYKKGINWHANANPGQISDKARELITTKEKIRLAHNLRYNMGAILTCLNEPVANIENQSTEIPNNISNSQHTLFKSVKKTTPQHNVSCDSGQSQKL